MQKKVVVYETKSVNELSIQNFSNEDVYVQSGDIVKGGQQDRMIGVDLIVPPRQARCRFRRFASSTGRWSGRGNERATVFSSSSDVVGDERDKAGGEAMRIRRAAFGKT